MAAGCGSYTWPMPEKTPLTAANRHSKPLPLSLRLVRLMFSGPGRVFPRLLGGWAYRLWFRTRRYPDSPAGRRAIASAQRGMLSVDGIPVATYRWGEHGPLVVFVHGWSGRGSQVAAFVEPLLAAGFRVMSVDAPGHGDTPGEKTNIIECSHVLQVLASEYGPVHGFITHSFGGMVLAYAMHLGVPAERVVMISAPATMEFLVDNYAAAMAMPPAVVDDLNRRLDDRFDGDFRERISTVNNVGRLRLPALIIHDEDDVGVPWQQGKAIADAWPGSRFMKTSGLGHGRILRDPATVRAAVEFLKR